MRVAATVTPTAAMPEGAGWRSATCGDEMEAPRALLRLMAWLSPAFPTGAFAYSHGLEWAVESGDVYNETSLAAWLTDIVTVGTGRSDTILLRHSHRAAAEPAALREIADLAYASGASRERQSESLDQGKAFMLAAVAWGASGCARAHTVSGRGRGRCRGTSDFRKRYRGRVSARFYRQPYLGGGSPGAAGSNRRPAGSCGARVHHS